MKRLSILLLIIVITNSLFGQGGFPAPTVTPGLPITQFLGADSTLVGNRGIFWSKFGMVYGRYTDTTAANLTKIDNYAGSTIFTTNTNTFWIRNSTATRWLSGGQAGGGSGGGSTTINGDTLIICTGTNVCDTFVIGGNVFNLFFINDSTIVICQEPTDTCIVAQDTCFTIPNCDTFDINFPQTIYQNGIWQRPGTNIVEYSDISLNGNSQSWLYRDSWLNTFYFTNYISGGPVWRPPLQVEQQQGWGLSTPIAAFKSFGNLIPDSVGYNNSVRFFINYTDRYYGAASVPELDSGYLGDRIGYWLGTNLYGKSSYGLGVDNPYSKYSSIFHHTLDTLYTDVLTFIGGRPPLDGLINDPLETPNTPMSSMKILTLGYDKEATWYGYVSANTSLRAADTTNYKVLVAHTATGEMRWSPWLGAGATITADNGLTMSTATNVQLGGTLIKNTTINDGGGGFFLYIQSAASVAMLIENNGAGQGMDVFSSGGLSARLATGNLTTNTVLPTLRLERNSNATPAVGMGTSLDFALETSDFVNSPITNQIISKWTDPLNATRTSQFIITGVNSGTTANKLIINGNGSHQMPAYGDNTFTGTATRLAAWDVDGNLIEEPPISAQNGLTEYSTNSIGLGGTLDQTTTVNTAGFGTTWTGNNAGNIFAITNGGAGGGIMATAGSGIAGTFGSNSTFGAHIYRTPAANLSDAVSVVKIERGTQGGTPLAGIAGSIDFFNTATTGAFVTNKIVWSLTDPTTATRTSKYYFTGIFRASEDTLYEAGGNTALTEGAATAFATTTIGSGTTGGGEIVVTVSADDGVDYQSRTLRFIWTAVNKSGTTTIAIETPVEAVAVSAGTLTATITAVDAGSGLIHFQANATSSLSQTTLRASCHLVKNY